MSKLEKMAWGYEYTSDNGIAYEVGEVSSEYNVIVDNFLDICELFDGNILIKDCLVDYVYGDLMSDDEGDVDDIKGWLDKRIAQYENHERTIRFYRDIVGREDTLYKCYLGFAEERCEQSTRISRERLEEIAREDRV